MAVQRALASLIGSLACLQASSASESSVRLLPRQDANAAKKYGMTYNASYAKYILADSPELSTVKHNSMRGCLSGFGKVHTSHQIINQLRIISKRFYPSPRNLASCLRLLILPSPTRHDLKKFFRYRISSPLKK